MADGGRQRQGGFVVKSAKCLERAPRAAFEPVRFEDPVEVLCACCQEPLERHQPDPGQPDRQLGTCTQCPAWFLIDARKGVMYLLPACEP
jgi:hypothetical protein